ISIHILIEDARSGLERAPRDLAQVACCIQVDAEWIVGIQGRDRDVVGETAGTGVGSNKDRLRRRPVLRLPVVIETLEIDLDVVIGLITEVCEDGPTLLRRQQVIEGGEVKSVGVAPVMVGTTGRIQRIPTWCGGAVIERGVEEMPLVGRA